MPDRKECVGLHFETLFIFFSKMECGMMYVFMEEAEKDGEEDRELYISAYQYTEHAVLR